MFCCNTFSDLIIGIISSVIAAILVLLFNAIKEWRKYSGPVGKYSGYSPIHGDVSNIDLAKPVSEATIKHIKKNKLHLTLKELNTPKQWSGVIAMETEGYGTVSWRYEIIDNKPVDLTTHIFGFKRLTYLTVGKKKVVYLVGEDPYGTEVLIQKE